MKEIKGKVTQPENLFDLRRTKKDDILIVLKQGEKTEELKKTLMEAVKEKAEGVPLTPKTKKVTLEIRSMDEFTSEKRLA